MPHHSPVPPRTPPYHTQDYAHAGHIRTRKDMHQTNPAIDVVIVIEVGQ